MKECHICQVNRNPEEIKHLPIYAFGSEGINVCEACQIAISEFVRVMQSTANRSRKQGYLLTR